MNDFTLIEEGFIESGLDSRIRWHKVHLSESAGLYQGCKKDLAFAELEKASKKDPNNIEVIILKGKLLWSIDQIDEDNEIFWLAHDLDPIITKSLSFYPSRNLGPKNFAKKRPRLFLRAIAFSLWKW